MYAYSATYRYDVIVNEPKDFFDSGNIIINAKYNNKIFFEGTPEEMIIYYNTRSDNLNIYT